MENTWKKEGRVLMWNTSQYRLVRDFILTTSHIERCFIGRLIDEIEKIKKLNPGEERFIVCSPFECLASDSLEKLNEILQWYDREVEKGKLSKNYKPSGSGWAIKRTPTKYIYKRLSI